MRAALATLALAACGYPEPALHVDDAGSGGGGSLMLGGTVTGLSGASGLVLQNNGTDDKPVISDGAFQFDSGIAPGATYDVTVSVQPTNPSEMCSVANGTGTATADVTGIAITCAPASYTIGGTVYGLTGSLNLTDNGSDTLTGVTNGPFTFAMQVKSGSGYSVTSSSGTCPVFGATGTVGNANVTSVVVNCNSGSGPYALGGTISGLDGRVVLRNSVDGDVATVTANGSYAFSMLVPSGNMYSVTVQTQPSYPPADQVCTVTNGSGIANGNIQNVNVSCTTDKFTVGGSVTGVTGTVVVQNNGVDNTALAMGTSFYAFATPIASGAPYSVTISQKPVTLACSILNASGTVANSNVANADINCTYADPGIACGSSFCTVGSQVCCDPFGSPSCKATANCSLLKFPCDDTADCGGSKVCCASTNGSQTQITGVSCSLGCTGQTLCDPNAASPCAGAKTCQPWAQFPPYYRCQ